MAPGRVCCDVHGSRWRMGTPCSVRGDGLGVKREARVVETLQPALVAVTQMSGFECTGLGAGGGQNWNVLPSGPGDFVWGWWGVVSAFVLCCSLRGRPVLRLTQPVVLI